MELSIKELKHLQSLIEKEIKKMEQSESSLSESETSAKESKKDPEKMFAGINLMDVTKIHTNQNYIALHFTGEEAKKRKKAVVHFLISMRKAMPWLEQFGFVRIGKRMTVNARIGRLELNERRCKGWILFDNSEKEMVSKDYLDEVILYYRSLTEKPQ